MRLEMLLRPDHPCGKLDLCDVTVMKEILKSPMWFAKGLKFLEKWQRPIEEVCLVRLTSTEQLAFRLRGFLAKILRCITPMNHYLSRECSCLSINSFSEAKGRNKLQGISVSRKTPREQREGLRRILVSNLDPVPTGLVYRRCGCLSFSLHF